MERKLEGKLKQYISRVIEHTTLTSILSNLGYKRVNDKIVQLKRKGVLTPIKSGLYIYNPIYDETLISKEIIANILLGPSYISLDYALWYYGIIPESVYEVQSVTIKRSKIYKTALGVFSYKHIKKELYSIGLELHSQKSGNFIMASKEKALCDKVYFTKDIDLRSKVSMREFLEDDLRLDMDEFIACDISIFERYFKISKSKKIEILKKVIEGLNP